MSECPKCGTELNNQGKCPKCERKKTLMHILIPTSLTKTIKGLKKFKQADDAADRKVAEIKQNVRDRVSSINAVQKYRESDTHQRITKARNRWAELTKCPHCGKTHELGADYCQHCKGKLFKTCPVCKNKIIKHYENACNECLNKQQIKPQEPTQEILNEQVICSGCGALINPQEKNCPYCLTEIKAKTKYCRHCGNELKPEAKYCPKCGKSLIPTKYCRHCGNELKPEAKYCPKCGSQIVLNS